MHFWRYSSATDVGLQRNNNEDSYLSCPELGLWVVADGMGGHAAGEVASDIVSQSIKEKIRQGNSLLDAIQFSHQQVLDAAADGRGSQGMGSTVVALLSRGQHYTISWVGDSRAYLWSPYSEPSFVQMTTDHSYVQMLYQTGAISESELDTHPEKNIITQCLGSIELESVQVESKEGEWQKNEWIVLCSDGLSDAVPAHIIAQILHESKNVRVATQSLVESALSYGGKDNITVTIVECPGKYQTFLQAFTASLSNFFK
ncbi:PP2C family protein-serine/threonine phosphatase [Agarilytica rhodophyticola]|uniref:PP2C family protein-serine/threonine phosphatase n=1 Tax=Agarilytica rhodophyticola TaxID=1737490 RepID=UPI000B349F9E|nr:protein phosphatase 2C domain-containing protein [Agarilytica rhodophyticola]